MLRNNILPYLNVTRGLDVFIIHLSLYEGN